MEKLRNFATVFVVGLFSVLMVVGCNSVNENNNDNTNTTETTSDEVRMDKPDELGMSQDSLDAKVAQKGVDATESEKTALIEEASTAVDAVSNAIEALEVDDTESALNSMEYATGKLEIILARDPDLALVPLDVSVTTQDLVADLETIETIKKATRKAIKNDHFQVVRDEIANLASEIRVETVQVPLATFPTALKVAAALIEDGETDAAKLALYDATNTLIIEEQRIPLPILRAEVMINQAKKSDAHEDDKKKEVLQLLDNAEYQLIMAEELGYGKRDREYAALNKAIKELKKSVESDGDSQGLFQSLKEKLAKFKNRIVA